MTDEEFLVFRYNLYMIECMYDYIIEKIENQNKNVNQDMLKYVKRRDPLYKFLNTTREDFSKYKHGTKGKSQVTMKVRKRFEEEDSEFQRFICGQDFIVYNEDEEYCDDHDLILSDTTIKDIKTAVDSAWRIARETVDYDLFETNGIVVKLAARLMSVLYDLHKEYEEKKKDINVIIDEKIKTISELTFSQLDMCSDTKLNEWKKEIVRLSSDIKTIIEYRNRRNKQ